MFSVRSEYFLIEIWISRMIVFLLCTCVYMSCSFYINEFERLPVQQCLDVWFCRRKWILSCDFINELIHWGIFNLKSVLRADGLGKWGLTRECRTLSIWDLWVCIVSVFLQWIYLIPALPDSSGFASSFPLHQNALSLIKLGSNITNFH